MNEHEEIEAGGIDAETVARLKSEHGNELVLALGPHGPLVFKKPSAPVWARFQNDSNDDKSTPNGVLKQLAMSCLVYPCDEDTRRPDQAALATAFTDKPGLPAVIAAALSELAGVDKNLVKKL